MITLVCGGRNYRNRDFLFRILDSYPITRIIHGGAFGADNLAGEWAKTRNIECIVFPALWKFYGNRAGSIRNLQMIVEGHPELVIAFPGGAGTRNMVKQAKGFGIPTVLHYHDSI